MAFANDTDGWAVGDTGHFFHWDGHAWELAFTSTEGLTLFAVEIFNGTEFWAAGESGYVYLFD
jgi:photosystem II stability/assembly factor-like uncharacterized protein